MDIFNAFYFSTISFTVDIFKIIAYQISGSRALRESNPPGIFCLIGMVRRPTTAP